MNIPIPLLVVWQQTFGTLTINNKTKTIPSNVFKLSLGLLITNEISSYSTNTTFQSQVQVINNMLGINYGSTSFSF